MDSKYSIDPNNFDINAPLHPEAVIGLRLFNQGEYFDSHERLEDAWAEDKSDFRLVYQAIIQVAVIILHCQISNYLGAIELGEKAQAKFILFPDHARGINLAKLHNDLNFLLAEVKRLGPDHINELDPTYFRQIDFVVKNDS